MYALVRREWALLATVVGAAGLYAGYAVLRHWRFETGLDLAIFDQAIWHYSRLETPASTVSGAPNLLGEHFHPILVLLSPLYWVWSDPRVLLIAQAVLVASSIVPVVVFARSRLGEPAALLVGLAYATFWGIQAGIGYDFHEVAFAPLLIALAILFADRRRWVPFFVTVLLLLCVKESLSLFVVFLGIYLLSRRDLRPGLITIALGAVAYVVITDVVIPHWAYSGAFNFWTYHQLGDTLPDALWQIAREPWLPVEVALDNAQKRETLLYLLLPFFGLALLSRIGILAIPLVAERFLSTNSQFWGTDFHYTLAIAPVLAMGAAAGLANLLALYARRRTAAAPRSWAIAGAGAVAAANIVVAGWVVPHTTLARATTLVFYDRPAYAAPVGRALERVPANASVAAADFMLPRLTERQEAYEIQPGRGPTDFIVTGLLEPVGAPVGNASYRDQQRLLAERIPLYVPIFYDEGWVVLRARRPGEGRSTGILRPLPAAQARALLRADQAYFAALTGDGVRLAGCGPCTPRDFARFYRAHARLTDLLARAVPLTRGGCNHLTRAALAGMRTVERDFTLALDSRSALRRLQEDIVVRDLPGRVDRLVLLCSPRAG